MSIGSYTESESGGSMSPLLGPLGASPQGSIAEMDVDSDEDMGRYPTRQI
jgi:hypothetical protein